MLKHIITKNVIKYDIYEYLRRFNDKGLEQIVGTSSPWSLEKSIEHGIKQAVQTLIYQGLNKRKYYSIDTRNRDGKLTGYGTRGGRKKKTRKKRGGVLKDIALNDIG